ncbi:MAG: hypothetical protein ACYCS7_08485 [Acidimicrobiales bacterium]
MERLRYVARGQGEGPSVFVPEVAAALVGLGDDHLALVPACRRLLSRHPEMGPLWWLSARMLGSSDPRGEACRCVEEISNDRTPWVLAGHMPDEARVVVLGWPELASAGLRRRGDAQVLTIDTGGEAYGLGGWLRQDDVEVDEVGESGLGAAVAESDLVILEAWALGAVSTAREPERSAGGPEASTGDLARPRSAQGEFVAVSGSRAAAAVARSAGVAVWLVAGEGRVLPAKLWEALRSNFDAVNLQAWERPDEVLALEMVDSVVGPTGMTDPAGALRRADCPVVAELLGSLSS